MRDSRIQAARPLAALALVLGAAVPLAAAAQSAQAGPWRYGASVYVYLPSMGGSSSFPADSGGSPINVSSEQIVDALKMAFMGSFSAHNGQWGAFTDVMYLDLGASKTNSRDFTIGNVGLPAGTSADLAMDLKGVVWTMAGEYRVQAQPEFTLDLLAGARLLDLRQTLRWNISGNLGPIQPSGRSGSASADLEDWDAIVGVKGRLSFGDRRQWSAPFYLDVGTGQSDLTWQVAGGIAYAFQWGELTAMWRYLAYEMKPDKTVKDLNFNGPMIGATFRW